MSPEANWQANATDRQGPRSAQDFDLDNLSVPRLLRRLITRVEESERRYGEALEELHTRLDRLSKTAETVPALGATEEEETLERLRSQLGTLAGRLEHPEASEPSHEKSSPSSTGLCRKRARQRPALPAARTPSRLWKGQSRRPKLIPLSGKRRQCRLLGARHRASPSCRRAC